VIETLFWWALRVRWLVVSPRTRLADIIAIAGRLSLSRFGSVERGAQMYDALEIMADVWGVER